MLDLSQAFVLASGAVWRLAAHCVDQSMRPAVGPYAIDKKEMR